MSLSLILVTTLSFFLAGDAGQKHWSRWWKCISHDGGTLASRVDNSTGFAAIGVFSGAWHPSIFAEGAYTCGVVEYSRYTKLSSHLEWVANQFGMTTM